MKVSTHKEKTCTKAWHLGAGVCMCVVCGVQNLLMRVCYGLFIFDIYIYILYFLCFFFGGFQFSGKTLKPIPGLEFRNSWRSPSMHLHQPDFLAKAEHPWRSYSVNM